MCSWPVVERGRTHIESVITASARACCQSQFLKGWGLNWNTMALKSQSCRLCILFGWVQIFLVYNLNPALPIVCYICSPAGKQGLVASSIACYKLHRCAFLNASRTRTGMSGFGTMLKYTLHILPIDANKMWSAGIGSKGSCLGHFSKGGSKKSGPSIYPAEVVYSLWWWRVTLWPFLLRCLRTSSRHCPGIFSLQFYRTPPTMPSPFLFRRTVPSFFRHHTGPPSTSWIEMPAQRWYNHPSDTFHAVEDCSFLIYCTSPSFYYKLVPHLFYTKNLKYNWAKFPKDSWA